MKRQRLMSGMLVAAAVATLSVPPQASACAFAPETYFTFTNHPDFPLKQFAAGDLGILQPGYARSYLLVAYRYLVGKPLTKQEQDGAVALWEQRMDSRSSTCDNDIASVWLTARGAVPGIGKVDTIAPERQIPGPAYQTICNCQSDAFTTAARTLKTMLAKYGPQSDAVKEWIKAQDQVFANCYGPSYGEKESDYPKIPQPLDSTDDFLKHQRQYQIAAANFYAMRYPEAISQFEAIAADASSPWQKLAAYLHVRAMIRLATVQEGPDNNWLNTAGQTIDRLLQQPQYTSLKDDLQALANYVHARLAPEQHVENLLTQQWDKNTLNELTKTVDNIVHDDGNGEPLPYDKLPDSIKRFEPIDWAFTFQRSDAAARAHALKRWQERQTTPWLLAVASVVNAKDPAASAVLRAANSDIASPARWTLFYHANRLKLQQGKETEVRQALDRVLASPPADLSLSSLNALKLQRLALATSLDELIRFGIQTPTYLGSTGFVEQVPDDVQAYENKTAKPEKPLFTADFGMIVDGKLPVAMLAQLAQNQAIPTELRAHLAWTSWVRAILLDNQAVAKQLAQTMRPFNKAKQALIDRYLAAATPEERKFAAALLMLQFSSAQPVAGWGPLGDDAYGDARSLTLKSTNQ
jgi:hypothetical protein